MNAAARSANQGGPRVTRSFAFIDLCGFTDFVDAKGDAEAVIELRCLRSAVRDVAPLHGIRVDKWLGDGVMLVGVEIEPVVIAVVGIEQRFRREGRLALRAGIASGPVILLEGDDYVGRAVNLASRLCDHAEAGQVLAAQEGLVLPDGIEASGYDRVQIRGMVNEVAVLTLEPEQRSTGAAIRSIVGELTNPVRMLRPLPPFTR
jgi:adenylate cyclase